MATANGGPVGGLNALTASEAVLSYFWDLASLDQDVRDKAANGLVDELLSSQRQYEQEQESEEEEGDGTGPGKGGAVAQALRRCSPLMAYALKRLVKGLGSGRQGARQGFALALALVLGKAGGCLTAQGAAAVVAGMLEAGSKGAEARDMLLGQVFGYGAIVRSGLVPDAPVAREIAAALVQIADKKSFLREVAAAVLLELLERVPDSVLADVVRRVEGLRAWLAAPPASSSPEALLLAVRLWARLPADVVAACQLLPAGSERPPPALFTVPSKAAGKAAGPAAAALLGSRAHVAELVPVLRDTSRSHPRLHSLWPTLLALLIPGFTPDKEQRQSKGGQGGAPRPAELELLWGSVVEGELFTSSHERKALGFTLFALLLPHLQSEHVGLVFTPNFLRCLSNNLSKQDSYLHATAKKCLERITAFAEKTDAGTRVAVTLALKQHGGAGFEKLTKAKKAGSMLEGLGGQALQDQIAQLQHTFHAAAGTEPAGNRAAGSGAGSDEDEAEGAGVAAAAAPPQQQQWAVEQLGALCKLGAAGVEDKRAVLRFLALHAFLRLDPHPAGKGKGKGKDKSGAGQLQEAAQCSAVLLPAARQLCAARLIALADSLSKPTSGKGRQQQQKGKAQQGGEKGAHTQAQQQQQQQQQGAQPRQDFVTEVVAFVQQTAAAPGATLLAAEASEAAEEALADLSALGSAVAARLQAAGAIGGEEAGRLRALQQLVGLMALGVLGDPEAADPGVAQDLARVYNAAFEGEESEEGPDGAPPPHWMDVLMDVLLSQLARTSPTLPSAPLREAVEQVFRAFCADLTGTGMQDMLRIVARPLESGKSGEDEDEDGIFDSDEEEEEGGDAGESDSDEGGSQEAGSESEEEEEEGEEEGEEPAAAKAGGESGSDDEDDEGDLSDEAMFRMDAKLAAFFAAAQDSKRGARAQRNELLNFKMRVIALLEAFCKKVPDSPLLPSAVLPLLSALSASSGGGAGGVQQGLAERLAGLIQNKLCRSKPEASGKPGAAGGVAGEELAAALRRCLYLASRSPDKRLQHAAAAAYHYLLRVAAGAAGGSTQNSTQASESVSAALRDLFSKKRTRLGRPFFEAMLRPPLALGPLLLPALLQYAAIARSEYMRGEALGLLEAALKVHSLGMEAALVQHQGGAAAVVLDVVQRSGGGKPGRAAEGVQAACTLVQALGRAGAAMDGKAGRKAQEAVAAALQAAPPPKVAGQLQRLAELLQSGGGGAGGKKEKPAAAAKQQQQQQQQQQQPGPSPGKRKSAGPGKAAAGQKKPKKQ